MLVKAISERVHTRWPRRYRMGMFSLTATLQPINERTIAERFENEFAISAIYGENW